MYLQIENLKKFYGQDENKVTAVLKKVKYVLC